jgi:hypothetical protein
VRTVSTRRTGRAAAWTTAVAAVLAVGGASLPVAAAGSGVTAQGMAAVRAWAAAARHGEAVGIPFKDRENLGVVNRAWGQGKSAAAGAGIYVTFAAHHAAFGINQGVQIFDVRSFAPSLDRITLADVEAVLGPPGLVRRADGTTIDLYTAGPTFQLLWVFSGTATTVNHVDVVWPRGTINLMAQNVPNPTFTVLRSASTPRSLAFRIDQAPPGNTLVELEWLPAVGSAFVVRTGPQVRTSAPAGGVGFARANGVYRLDFDAALAGQSGVLRVIYENPAGTAIMGTSGPITLP